MSRDRAEEMRRSDENDRRTDRRLSQSVRGADPFGLRGLGGDVPVPPRVQRGSADLDESRFWFQDGVALPRAALPVRRACATTAASSRSTRRARASSSSRPSLGVEYRILNGYVYLSANSVTDEATLARRAELFARRGGYYYEHWDELYARWLREGRGGDHASSRRSRCPTCPRSRTRPSSPRVAACGSSHALLVAYDRLLEGLDRICQYHFELLNLGYGAYLVFYELCRAGLSRIADQTIAKMVSGSTSLLLRPDEELRRLAAARARARRCRAREGRGRRGRAAGRPGGQRGGSALARRLRGDEGPVVLLLVRKRPLPPPPLVDRRHDASDRDDRLLHRAPRGRRGHLAPDEAVIAERDRITAEYRALLPEDTREAFDEQLALARTVFPYVENHNFYVDHWYHTIFWNKVREFGALLARHGFLAEQEDVFFLRHDEVRSALDELRLSWSSGGVGAVARPGALAADRRAAQGDLRGDARVVAARRPSARCRRRSPSR